MHIRKLHVFGLCIVLSLTLMAEVYGIGCILVDWYCQQKIEEIQKSRQEPKTPEVFNVDNPKPIKVVATKETLARKNRNPLNIKTLRGSEKWEGQIGSDSFGHAKFKQWEHGVRAFVLTMVTYHQKYGIDTVPKLVKRYAEGNHEEYIKFICYKLNITDEEKKINILKRIPELIKTMAKFESGIDLPDYLVTQYDPLTKLEWRRNAS